MSTVASIVLYIVFCLWRWHADRVAEGRRAEQDAEILSLKSKMAAIEAALRKSPFIPYDR